MRPWRFRYISNALAERSTAAHWMSSEVVPTSRRGRQQEKYFTSRMREVLSARSSMRPSRQKCQASLCVMVASVTPGEQVAGVRAPSESSCGSADARAWPRPRSDHQVELVDLLPHLRRDDLAHRPRVLARRAQAGEDRVRILRVEGEELDDVLAAWPRRSAWRMPRCRRWCRPAAATAGADPTGRSSMRLRLTSMNRATFSARST